MNRLRPARLALAAALAATLAAAPARAAEVDKHLPDDTELLVSVNVRQVLDSDLFKKYALEQAREALKQQEDLKAALDELNFDPFRDLDRVLVALPSGSEQDRGLLVAYGHFDLDRIKARAEDLAKNQPEVLKVLKVPDGAGGKAVVYQVNAQGQPTPFFVALPDKGTLLASPGKDYVVDALQKEHAAGGPQLKNKDFQALLEKMDDAKQAVSVAGVGAALTEGSPDEVKALFAKVEAVGGGVRIADDLKIEVAVSAKSAEDAKELRQEVVADLKQARLLLTALSFADRPEIDLLLDVVNGVKVTGKDKEVLLKATVSADALEEALKKDKKP
jgi:hypothetical protein